MDPSREAYWERKLRPIRLNAEPLEYQLSRRYLGSIVISAVTSSIGLMILAIFTAFGRFDVGLRFFGLAFLPVIAWYWLDYAILRTRVSAYLSEQDRAKNDAPPG